jgi:aminomethyltransferase
MSEVKSTPLRDEHIALGGKMVEFAGWYMPVEYEGLRSEHAAVREKAGLFDVSHMGEVRVSGPKALATLQWLTTNDVARLKAGEAQYSLLPNAEGGLVDDIIVYCVKPNEDYLLCVNASNTDRDFEWMLANNRGAEIRNESSQWGQIAIQGPEAVKISEITFDRELRQIPSFNFIEATFQGARCLIARTGYTGEDGFEIFVPAEKTVQLWRALLQEGATFGLKPAGLGARDTLRTEMKYPLYGHEIDATTNPFAAGLGWVIKPEKKDFIARGIIVGVKEKGLSRKLIGFKLIERGIPRQGYKLFSFDDREIGIVTSGTPSPTLNESIGVAYVEPAFAAEGAKFNVEIRSRKVQAQVVKTPFVHPKKG